MSPQILSLAQMTGALLAVLALMGLTLAGLRRLMVRGLNTGANAAQLRTLATLPLGERRYLTLVEVGGEKLLLGVTPSNVNLLARDVKLHADAHSPKPATGKLRTLSHRLVGGES